MSKNNYFRTMTNPAVAALQNARTFDYYFSRLQNIQLSVYEWKDLPETVDARWLELNICLNGMCLFFKDEVMGYLTLPCTIGSTLDVYNIPTYRRAYAANGYQAERGKDDSVIIFHNYLHQVPIWDLEMFATRLADYQRTIDINVNSQKTPIALVVEDSEKATWENTYLSYAGNVPVIIANKGMNPNAMQVLKTDAPFVADAIEELRTMVWNDAMSYIGISNVNVTKKERLITDEVQRNMGGVLASRYSPLEMRRDACNKINKMFGLNISVDFREDILAYQSQIIGETMEQIKDGELNDVSE